MSDREGKLRKEKKNYIGGLLNGTLKKIKLRKQQRLQDLS
jgi:hypothetical protein